MERTRFNKPVSILVGLGYPAKIYSAREAYEYLLDRPTIAASKAQSVALKVCKAALKGEVDPETARSAFVAFAERNVPGCVTAQADEIEHELDVALLRLGGGAQKGCRAGGKYGHKGDQRSKHGCLLICGQDRVRSAATVRSGRGGI